MLKMEANIAGKPKTLTRTLNNILISWDNVFIYLPEDAKYILQIENAFREWNTVYWWKQGPKTQVLVDNLQPSSCYNFRLRYVTQELDSEWVKFKSATDALSFFVMHFTRAVKFGKKPIIRRIINKRPILLETENREGKTPLIQAIESGNLQMVTFLFNLGANVNTATLITKRTPLMVALFNGELQIASLLIDRGASLLAKDCNHLTGLHHAIDSGKLENVEFCLNQNFDFDAKDNKGWTPLVRAVILNCSDEIISLLLIRGADPKTKDRNSFDFNKHVTLVGRPHLVVQANGNSIEEISVEQKQEEEVKDEKLLQTEQQEEHSQVET